ncbi:hypothetical protein EKI51_09490 [Corynebacterium sanguinis]|uniref:Uncharacterized protein n=1 Tax=Corynebacterium liangguodongii TaxID=2079535 RepID=A0A2S0WH37_9CORY|nr:hypothetical protein [Corynebacterium sanguinis]AWB85089.1 hypothetical protein C3E79_06545 [Corynebacterium liangguodongii]MCT2329077.1 hypothetical protein [Corynebacterium sanguinis]PWC00326.1 hypothetical protein DF219_03185 [Corynebacterium liangguodongii]TVS22481.1 hypothetical protein EKI51_09490 [Corynebacterium sanguinis]
MTVPAMQRLTPEQAERELAQLEASVDGGIQRFEQRAYRYELSPRERGVWERISELRWLLGRE